MYNTVMKKIRVPALRILTAVIAASSAVLLPQVFHAIGVISGTGAAAGAALLPMHLPVILCGFLAGPSAGIIAGIGNKSENKNIGVKNM